MTIETAIKKAIEGGYKLPDLIEPYKWETLYGLPAVNATFTLDPLFWQSLGKAMGWEGLGVAVLDGRPVRHAWLHEWHRLIDHLAEGGSIESYFETLT